MDRYCSVIKLLTSSTKNQSTNKRYKHNAIIFKIRGDSLIVICNCTSIIPLGINKVCDHKIIMWYTYFFTEKAQIITYKRCYLAVEQIKK